MKKLSPEMTRVLKKIVDQIDLAKRYDDYHDYHMAERAGRYLGRPDYAECMEREEYLYSVTPKESLDFQEALWREAKDRDVALTSWVSSNTLRALASRGYVEILVDGGDLTDKVRLLRRPEQ